MEAGVGIVTTSLHGIEMGMSGHWDDHAVNWDCFKAVQERAPAFDRAIAALIQDLYERGMNPHSGGGLRMGQAIGTTDARGEAPDYRALHPNDFVATIYRHLGIDPAGEVTNRSGRPLRLLERGEPISELHSSLPPKIRTECAKAPGFLVPDSAFRRPMLIPAEGWRRDRPVRAPW